MEKIQQQYKILLKRQLKLTDGDYMAFEHSKAAMEQQSLTDVNPVALYDLNKDELSFLHCLSNNAFSFYNNTLSMHSYKALIHPDDLRFVLETEMQACTCLHKMPLCQLKQYKLIYECRIRDSCGCYHRILHQFVVVELDNNGEIWIVIMKLFIIDCKKDDCQMRTPTIINMETKEQVQFTKHPLLTCREIEVLQLLSQGLDSDTISKRLFISPETVKNHRKHILFKTQTEHTSQAMLYAKYLGIL
jgi:DNA-binding CsgD family transcriptional regulator